MCGALKRSLKRRPYSGQLVIGLFRLCNSVQDSVGVGPGINTADGEVIALVAGGHLPLAEGRDFNVAGKDFVPHFFQVRFNRIEHSLKLRSWDGVLAVLMRFPSTRQAIVELVAVVDVWASI